MKALGDGGDTCVTVSYPSSREHVRKGVSFNAWVEGSLFDTLFSLFYQQPPYLFFILFFPSSSSSLSSLSLSPFLTRGGSDELIFFKKLIDNNILITK